MKEGLRIEIKKLHVSPFPYDDKLTLSCVWEARVVCYHKGKRPWSERATPGSHQIFKKDAIAEGTRLLREKFEQEVLTHGN
jgi:hypothetical protein